MDEPTIRLSILRFSRETLGISSQGGDSHNKVIEKLTGMYRNYMLSLKSLRKEADYELKRFSEPYKVKGSYVKIQRLKALLEDILQKTKEELQN